MLDGANSLVSEDDGPADTTIKVSWDDWQRWRAAQLDGMTAFMTGKLKVEGDMSNAMQLQGVLASGKLRGEFGSKRHSAASQRASERAIARMTGWRPAGADRRAAG